MGWIECVRCKKLQRDFVARTFALIALVHPVSHRVSCSYVTIPNAPKHYETHQNMSLGSTGVDRVHSLQKIQTRLYGTNFCTSSARLAPSFVRQLNGPECTQILWNTPKRQFRVQWVDWVLSLRKIPMWLRGTNFCINCSSSPRLHRVSCSYETIPNAPKHYETHQNMSLGSNGWIRCVHCEKL